MNIDKILNILTIVTITIMVIFAGIMIISTIASTSLRMVMYIYLNILT